MESTQWICPGLGWGYLSLRDLGGLELGRDSEATLRWPGSLKMAANIGLESDYLSTLEMELDFQIHSMPIFPHLLKKGKREMFFCFRSDWREICLSTFSFPAVQKMLAQGRRSGPTPRTIEEGPAVGTRCLTGQPGTH